MLFSVVIPTYNRAALLSRALASVRGQRFTDFEVIVVDDGSTDATPDVVAQCGMPVRFIRQANAGPGAARNRGIAQATGEYVAFLDSDDLWFPWSLEAYAALVEQHGRPAFVAGKPHRFRDEGELGQVREAPPASERFPDYLLSGEMRWWGASSFVVRREPLAECGGFLQENINGEDGDLALKLGEQSGFVQVVSPETFAYREHESNVANDLEKLIEGAWHKINAERAKRYPGGNSRRLARWAILSRDIRPISIGCLRDGRLRDGLRLYGATWHWHLRLGRLKFLLAFPVAAARAALRRVV